MAQIISLDSLSPYIREVGLQRKDSWRMPRRIYDYQFLFCYRGVAHVTLREKAYRVTPGDLIIIQPNIPHQLWFDSQEPGDLYWFHCDFFLLPDREWVFDFYNTVERYITLFGSELPEPEHIRESLIFSNGSQLPEIVHFAGNDSMEYCFRAMYRAYTSGDNLWQLTARRCFYEILEAVLRQEDRQLLEGEGQDKYVIHQMKAYIAKHYFEPLSVEKITRKTGLNAEYASKLFHRKTGFRLVEYVTRYRINQAKKLLIDQDLSIADVAEMVGFSNENYFCSVLKKMEGKTPAKMRAHLLTLLVEEE